MAVDEDSLRLRTWFEALLGVPATDGNRIDVLQNGEQIFPAMLAAIGRAESTIDFATFNLGGSIGVEFADALAAQARRGLRVRVLLDHLGASRIPKDAIQRLRSAGGRVAWFRRLSNPRVWETTHRGHRKVLVCDRRVAFSGGVGVDDRWRGNAANPSERRDTHFRVRGPAVDALHAAFVNNWAETGQPIFEQGIDDFRSQDAAGSSPVQVVRAGARTGWGDIATLVRAVLGLARNHVHIAAAYFVPDKDTLALLCSAAGRGITVDLLVNGEHADKPLNQLASQAQYDTLLDAGVRVWLYEPTMLHMKMITVDGAAASVGSANFNARSFLHDEELNLVVFDPTVIEVLDRQFQADLRRARRLEPAQWAARGRRQKALEVLPGVISRHL